jgi:glycosyltransferase involved in cell wall biosynthesis
MNTPFFSIITVTYNADEVVRKTIESLKSQSFSDWELCIIDGKSSDNTISSIKSLNIRNCSIISEPDNGIYDAMNKGIRHCNGKWIYYLNAGDSFYGNDVLSKTAEAIAKYPDAEIVFGNIETIKGVIEQNITPIRRVYLEIPVCHQSIFYRNTKQLQSFDTKYRICADYEHFIRSIVSGDKIYKIPVVVANYQHGGLSHKRIINLQFERLKIAYRLFPAIYKIAFFLKFPYLITKAKLIYLFRR